MTREELEQRKEKVDGELSAVYDRMNQVAAWEWGVYEPCAPQGKEVDRTCREYIRGTGTLDAMVKALYLWEKALIWWAGHHQRTRLVGVPKAEWA